MHDDRWCSQLLGGQYNDLNPSMGGHIFVRCIQSLYRRGKRAFCVPDIGFGSLTGRVLSIKALLLDLNRPAPSRSCLHI